MGYSSSIGNLSNRPTTMSCFSVSVTPILVLEVQHLASCLLTAQGAFRQRHQATVAAALGLKFRTAASSRTADIVDDEAARRFLRRHSPVERTVLHRGSCVVRRHNRHGAWGASASLFGTWRGAKKLHEGLGVCDRRRSQGGHKAVTRPATRRSAASIGWCRRRNENKG